MVLFRTHWPNFRYYRISMTTRLKVFDLILCIIFASVFFGIAYDLFRRLGKTFRMRAVERIDWHDWKLIEMEASRSGLGEHGAAAYLSSYPPHSKDINETFGYNGYLSDKISLNRSLRDLRPPACITEKYSSELPSASVIVIFHNEHLSTLLRTCYSIWNRSPVALLKEIILVDDASTTKGLTDELGEYIAKHLPIVKLVKLDKRSGLIKARVIGARTAIADVLVFLDSHCEAYHNWLPPLLDAMANDYRTVMCPTIDIVSDETFEQKRQGFESIYAGRGGFDWNFDYKLLPLLPTSVLHPSKPFENPVMAGGLFAIHAKFFWEIGAYDSGLETYGGEQYELSFKIWQCHGRMLETACSRITHIYRHRKKEVNTHLHHDFLHQNYKRVAEVWMDEYKKHIFDRHPIEYANVDAGDISEQKALRDRLQCKPFKWYMENVAFDILKHYPVEEPSFAYGGIKNLGLNECVDTMGKHGYAPLGIYSCAKNISYPQSTQSFGLTTEYVLRLRFQRNCWTIHGLNEVWQQPCANKVQPDNKMWRYDLGKKWIINKKDGFCLDVDKQKRQLILSRCNTLNFHMKWEFGNVNATAYKTVQWYQDWKQDDDD